MSIVRAPRSRAARIEDSMSVPEPLPASARLHIKLREGALETVAPDRCAEAEDGHSVGAFGGEENDRVLALEQLSDALCSWSTGGVGSSNSWLNSWSSRAIAGASPTSARRTIPLARSSIGVE